ncbi:MAG: serine/threonine protein kinase, partial [Myxococcales bacterium]|nr:serine/threonine protein kinase [Myxococcales bacterium]
MTATGLPRRAVCPTCLRRYEPPPAAARCHDDGQPLLPLGEADGDPRIGTIAGERYLLLDVLGEGGMGVVYLAWQLQMARYVALKTLHPTGPNRDGLERRFLREVRATASLRSPHTLTVFDSGKLPSGDLYLAMERLHGAPLDRLLRLEGKLSPALARLVGLHVCRSLSEAHGAGIVHRDIKPANLVLERLPSGEPHVKVLDFGIAKLLDDASTDLTSTGSTLGSIAYMSPEQID